MHKVDSTAAIANPPTPRAEGTPGWFSHDAPYTVLTSDWANAVQAEIINVISDAGIALRKDRQDQLLTAIRKFGRIKMTDNVNLYVATTGNDTTGDGTAGAPFATIQHAAFVAMNTYDGQWFDTRIPPHDPAHTYTITVNVANGTYDAGADCHGIAGDAPIIFKGNGPSVCTINQPTSGAIFSAGFNCNMTIDGFKLGAPTGSSAIGSIPGICISAALGGVVTVKNIDFGATQRAHMETGSGGYIIVAGDYTISGGAEYHIISGIGGLVYGGSAPITVTLTGTPHFATFAWSAAGFIYCLSGNGTVVGTVRFIGAATGGKYLASTGGTFSTNGGGASFFPGDPGTGNATSGYYT